MKRGIEIKTRNTLMQQKIFCKMVIRNVILFKSKGGALQKWRSQVIKIVQCAWTPNLRASKKSQFHVHECTNLRLPNNVSVHELLKEGSLWQGGRKRRPLPAAVTAGGVRDAETVDVANETLGAEATWYAVGGAD